MIGQTAGLGGGGLFIIDVTFSPGFLTPPTPMTPLSYNHEDCGSCNGSNILALAQIGCIYLKPGLLAASLAISELQSIQA